MFADAETGDEILGYVAHEVAHEYFAEYSDYTKFLYKQALQKEPLSVLSKKYAEILSLVELHCDGFAALTMVHLKRNPLAFVKGLERLGKYFDPDPDTYHPSNPVRRTVVESVTKSTSIQKPSEVSPLLREIKKKMGNR